MMLVLSKKLTILTLPLLAKTFTFSTTHHPIRIKRSKLLLHSENLWSVEECIEYRDDIKFVDGSWYHKGERNGRQEYVSDYFAELV